MPITALSYIYGKAVTTQEFIKWVLNHPDSTWFKRFEKQSEKIDIVNLKMYVRWLDVKRPDETFEEFDMLVWNFIDCVTEPMGTSDHANHPIGVFQISTAQKQQNGMDLVIGARSGFIDLSHPVDLSIDLTSEPPAKFSLDGIVTPEECKYYLLQDD